MAKYCSKCGAKLSLLSSLGNSLCKDCNIQIKNEENQKKLELKKECTQIIQDIITKKSIDNEQIEKLKKQNKKDSISFYKEIFTNFESDGELEKSELETLQTIKSSLDLSNEEVDFETKVMPYHYVYMIRIENKLPTIKFSYEGNAPTVVLKKGELVHFSTPSTLREMKTVNLGYKSGSRGVSLRIMKGVSYRVGASRGHVMKEEKLVVTSRGYLLLTNKRVFLNPSPSYKPLSIPLDKILSYHCYKNGVEIYKDGRDKGYFFETANEGAPEIIGMSLGFLLGEY